MVNERIANWLRHWPSGTATGATPDLSIVLATDLGLKRSQNQDRVAVLQVGPTKRENPFIVVALADGMGGMHDGLECAVQTLATFFETIIQARDFSPKEMLYRASIEANKAVYRFAHSNGGATLSAVLIEQGSPLYTVNVGDSRIYARLNDFEDSASIRLTKDDNLEEAVGGVGKELLQFIGMGPGIMPHVDVCLHPIDRVVISSDGVHFIDDAVLNEIICNAVQITDVTKQSLTFARWRGSPDNASLAVFDLPEVMQSLAKLPLASVSISDPFGGLELLWSPQKIETASKEGRRREVRQTSDEVQASVSKRPRRLRTPVTKKKMSPDNEQLSIEIDSTPDAEDGSEGQNT